MGVSIHGEAYKVSDVISQITAFVEENGGRREDALPPAQFFAKVAPEFGLIIGDTFVTVWNEYYDEYNAASNFHGAVDHYYFPNHEKDAEESERGYWDGFWLDGGKSFGGGANASEILGSLFEDEFGYEGKFSDYE